MCVLDLSTDCNNILSCVVRIKASQNFGILVNCKYFAINMLSLLLVLEILFFACTYAILLNSYAFTYPHTNYLKINFLAQYILNIEHIFIILITYCVNVFISFICDCELCLDFFSHQIQNAYLVCQEKFIYKHCFSLFSHCFTFC